MKRATKNQSEKPGQNHSSIPPARTGYDHATVEAKWSKQWTSMGLYTTDINSANRPFYNLMMFPYPSAEGLHVGNMYAFTGSDVYGRFKRLQGYDVFEPIGLDGFGIHSENYALKVGRHPMDHASITQKNFYSQLRRIGAMFDWSRTVETYDADYYRWTQWLFVQMFKHGLAYRDKAEVNWCPQCKTVLADEQVIDGECERCGNKVEKRLLEQWFFRITAYAEKLLENSFSLDWSEKVKIAQQKWIGKKAGIIITHPVVDLPVTLETFSAYPAWLFADTFIVIAPDHPLVMELIKGTKNEKEVRAFVEEYTKNNKSKNSKLDEKSGVFTGRYVKDPFTGNTMPIWLANFALMTFGTGIIRCSAHDPRDYAFAVKYGIKLREVVTRTNPDEPVNAHTNSGVLKDSGPFSGKTISPAIINEMVDWIEKNGIGKRRSTFHLRDWLISRQRYWGPPIPMIKCETCLAKGEGERQDMPGWYCVPETQLPVILPKIDDYKPSNDGVAPLAKHTEFSETICPKCGGKAVRETDVSDTFLDSSWYFLRYPVVGSSSEKTEPFEASIIRKWLPVHMYTGGAEHSVLHLMYSRFITMALHDWGFIDFDEPFSRFYAHGLVIKDGAKMSKSKGNVVNPDEYIASYGADALRLYLMFMGPFDQGGDFRDAAMEGMSRWVGRIWRMGTDTDKLATRSTDAVLGALQKLIIKVEHDLERRRNNTAIASMMEFTNLVGEQGGRIGREDFRTFLLLLAPFAPHLAEELWQLTRGEADAVSSFKSIHAQKWPSADTTKILDEPVIVAIQVNGKLRETIQLDHSEASVQETVDNRARESEKIRKYVSGQTIRKLIFVPGKLLNYVV